MQSIFFFIKFAKAVFHGFSNFSCKNSSEAFAKNTDPRDSLGDSVIL